MKEGSEMGSKKSILSYLVNAFAELFLILMLLLNSVFSYFMFTFAHHFRLNKPCLCCSSSAFNMSHTDLLCHHHAALIASSRFDYCCSSANQFLWRPILLHNCICQNATYAAADDDSSASIDEKTILEGTSPDNNKSTPLITDLYSNENLVEFGFTEDEYDQKDIVHDDGGYRVVGGGNRFSWKCAFSEAQQLIIDGSTTCWLGHDHESAVAVGTREGMLDRLMMIKHKKVNEDESYSIAYTAEGDLVMDLCRNLTSAISVSTASDNVDAISQIKATTEQRADELSHQAHGEILALRSIENAEKSTELDEEDQPPEKSNGILMQSCLLYRTIERVHEKIDQAGRSVSPSPPFRSEDQGTSVDLSPEHANEQNGEDVPHALPNSPLPTNMEESYEMQVDRVEKIESYYVQHPLTSSLGLINNEEDKLPDTSSSFNGSHNHYSNWLSFEKRVSATEETFDGSINSDIECGEGISIVEKLKTALRAERKALHALYAELEEERNASAVAASQTMAMINRLQEEKASVQMEALQYQRMMEEQSDYDQEALQLLNDLAVKNEREKQELEKELEIHRKRVNDYETNERLMMLNTKEENGINCTPFNDVPQESFSNFEEERLSILEQFKTLEEKILTLDSENDYIMNGTENGCHDDVKGSYHRERRILDPKAKMLLPLFDATLDRNQNTELSRNENGHDFITSYPHSSASIYETENIEEEIDHVYDRLRSLEADNDFLMHCFSSLNRGDKGLELLQEILQYLRNLRTVQLEVRK